MKKIFGVIIGVLALTSVASADGSLSCGSLPILMTTLISEDGCLVGDYEFTNFVVTAGTLATNDTATLDLSGLNNEFVVLDLHDPSGFTSSFTLQYSITLNTSIFPGNDGWPITMATAGLQDNGGDSGTWTKYVYVPAAAPSPGVPPSDGALLGYEEIQDIDGLTGRCCGTGPVSFTQTAINITDMFSPTSTSGTILDLSNRFTQTAAEPSTMVLLGIALLGLGVVVRKRRRASA